ncbi:hypothetical protein FRB96_003988 [Tulasnella sp. 330]|nr:hypothetical protein FRB96_003988 [Tulasnella sp. 330]KAG8882612.1 hypothetical protein FRB97_008039 [Tulasnella sp. 331]KAG8888884.1 hypothetical protein FRB98_006549 [Tulasnella sp. 332]
MQTPSPQEIEREVAALRDIRRRSSQQGPGSIPLDPDLPPGGPASTSAVGYWDSYGQQQNGAPITTGPVDDLGSEAPPEADTASDDPSHLFWVPAHLHPELAPGEFRAFLKEHTSAHPDGMGAMPRTLSHNLSGTSMSRKKSMLSKQYKPSANDNVEDERVVTVKRNRSSIYSSAGPTLTIGDLQKLEELAEEAAKSDDPSKLRSMLRRSLSLNVAPSFIDQMDDIAEGDDADSPIIIPRPGQILRRSARTKIRKVGLPGDGGGHRFPASRRSARHKDDDPTSDNGHDSADTSASSIKHDERPVSYSEEAFILDAYGERRDSMTSTRSSMDESDEMLSAQSHSTFVTTAPPSTSQHASLPSQQRPTSPKPDLSISPPRGQTVRRVSPPPGPPHVEQPLPALRHPALQPHLEVPHGGVPSRTPSPTESELNNGRLTPSPTHDPFRLAVPPAAVAAPPIPIHAPQPSYPGVGNASASEPNSARASPAPSIRSTKSAKEKEKKGLLKGMWGGDKKKEREKNERSEAASRENREREGKEKGGGFFGSLFGGGKKHEETEQQPRGGLLSGAGPAAAAALLGASARRQAREPSPGPDGMGNSFARYPIHVERAVYRLSHIKLANPRRPLYEQVLISNLMFWYLGVINKVTTPASTPSTTPAPGATGAANSAEADGVAQDEKNQGASDREKAEKEKIEREREREREEKDRAAERERLEAEARDRERTVEKESRKRGTLVKSPPPGSGTGRRAEMPVRGPQYDVQHQMMEQERGGGGPAGYNPALGHGGRQMQRSNSAGPIPSQDPHHRRGLDPHYDPRNDPRNQQHHGRPPPPPPNQHPHHNQPYPPQPPQYQQQPYGGPQQPPYVLPPNQQPPVGNGFTQFAPPLPPGAMAPSSDQWLGPATSRDSPYSAAGGGPPIPGQPFPPVNARPPIKGGFPNGPGPGPGPVGPPNGPLNRPPIGPPVGPPNGPPNGPPPRLVGRSISASATSPVGPPPQMTSPARQQRPPGPHLPPPPPVNGAGGWQNQDRVRRGSSPQPPPPGGVRVGGPVAMDDMPIAYQQQNARGNPILR